MIERVTLTARHFYGHDGKHVGAIVHLPDWISNGYWSIQRSYVVNEHAINLDDFHDNFKHPRVGLYNSANDNRQFNGKVVSLNEVLWSAAAMAGEGIYDGMYLREVTQDKSRMYEVTEWVLRHTKSGKDLRLVCEPVDNSPKPMIKGDDGVYRVPPGGDCVEVPEYHCFVDETYIDALGLQAKDQLNGAPLSNKSTFLVAMDMSRCVVSVVNVDAELEQLPFIGAL